MSNSANRDAKAWERTKEKAYPFVILFAIGLAEYALIYNIYWRRYSVLGTWETVFLYFHTFILIMVVWCYLKTFFAVPGEPPLFWVSQASYEGILLR